jgi:hypothetical protein
MVLSLFKDAFGAAARRGGILIASLHDCYGQPASGVSFQGLPMGMRPPPTTC